MGGQIVTCERCAKPCRVAESNTPDARLLRKSLIPKGLCLECATTEFLRVTEPLGMLIEQHGPECLRLEHIQKQFEVILLAGRSDAGPGEIDWDVVIANWHLPFPPPKGGRTGGRRRLRGAEGGGA
jgi:hypothetical protein